MRHSLTLIYLSYTNIVVYEIMDAPSYVDLFIAGAVFFLLFITALLLGLRFTKVSNCFALFSLAYCAYMSP